jgi:hypothetical protein
MAPENRKWLPGALAVFVVLAGAVVGGFFGLFANMLYEDASWSPGSALVGPILGSLGGAGAGILWSWLMGRLSPQAGGLRILLAGIALGTIVGTLDTIFLHVGLMAAFDIWGLDFLFAILYFGIPAGLATGFVCGLLRWGVVAWMRRNPPRESNAGTP